MAAPGKNNFAAIIMAAGQGKRMNSDLPKVLHAVNNKSMLDWTVEAATAAGAVKIVVIVGHGREKVIENLPPGVEYAVQEKQLGTGHAARCAELKLREWTGPIAVLSGDVPLLRASTIRTLANKQIETSAAVAVLTAKVQGDHAYGRIVRDGKGAVKAVVENKDATAEQRKIDEINSGTYVFGPGKLFPALAQLRDNNAQKEFYLTDVVAQFAQSGQTVTTVQAASLNEVLGVNTAAELAVAQAVMIERQSSSVEVCPVEQTVQKVELLRNLRIFTGNANNKLAQDICTYLGIPLGRAEVSHFPDGETKVRIEEDIRGRDVFIVQPTSPPVNDHLIELLVLIDAARRASAQRITAVMPYFGYARQDRKHEGRVPITAKLVANLITHAGADRVMCVELHAEQIQGFFDLPVDHLYATPVQLKRMQELNLPDLTILSPDPGRIKMANAFAKRLNGTLAVIDKRRTGDSDVIKGHVVGEIKGKNALIVDDMISTAGSVTQAVQTALEYGAKSVIVMATHPVFCGRAFERLNGLPVLELAVCDTIELKKRPENINLKVLSVGELLGEAINRTHNNQSVSSLFV